MFFAPVVRNRAVAPSLRSFDRSFERFVNEAFFANTHRGVQVIQDDKAWTITLDVPGLAREDLVVEIEGNTARIETTPQAKRQVKAAYELPADIDATQSTAKVEHGVLTLSLAKLAPVNSATRLAID